MSIQSVGNKNSLNGVSNNSHEVTSTQSSAISFYPTERIGRILQITSNGIDGFKSMGKLAGVAVVFFLLCTARATAPNSQRSIQDEGSKVQTNYSMQNYSVSYPSLQDYSSLDSSSFAWIDSTEEAADTDLAPVCDEACKLDKIIDDQPSMMTKLVHGLSGGKPFIESYRLHEEEIKLDEYHYSYVESCDMIAPVMWGVDQHHRPLFAYRYRVINTGKIFVTTIFVHKHNENNIVGTPVGQFVGPDGRVHNKDAQQLARLVNGLPIDKDYLEERFGGSDIELVGKMSC